MKKEIINEILLSLLNFAISSILMVEKYEYVKNTYKNIYFRLM